MDPVTSDAALIERLFHGWERWPRAEAKFKVETVIDREHGRFLLLSVGWDGPQRIYSVLVHVDLIDGKFWIQRDNTEEGFARELVAAGVPPSRIVLGFYPEAARPYGEFAVQ